MKDIKSSDIASEILDESFDMKPEEIRKLGYHTVDLIVDYFKNINKTQLTPSLTLEQMIKLLDEPLPYDEQNPQSVLNECEEKIIPNAIRIGNPRLLGWILASGTVIGSFADGLASAINQNVTVSGSGVATAVELLVINWIKEILGYDSNAAGILVSGGSIANLTGLAVGRNVKANFDVLKEGMQQNKNMVFYASEETHISVSKAAGILGIGRDNIRLIKVDENFCLDVKDLNDKITQDQKLGKHPFAVVATAGTVNTGAIDPLDPIADICQKYNLWFHVDAAYGGFAALSPDLKPLLRGISRADSIAINPHKWLFIPYEAGCVLVKNPKHLKDTFTVNADYVHLDDNKKSSNYDIDFSDYGLQLSRDFRALKIWMSLKQYGVKKYSKIINQNVNCAKLLAALVEESSSFILANSVNLSIVCFQYTPEDLKQRYPKEKTESYLNQLNQEIIKSMRADARILLSSTIIKNKFVLRACIVNYRTTKQDIKTILKIIKELGVAADKKLQNTKF
jgi:glutamate/tyrosine decarboxylase-like PLP-dependent enzyme